MDKLETSSNASDSPSSNLSSLSGLTGFEEEFYSIKSLIDSKTQPFFVDSINNNYFNEHNVYPDCFGKLNMELQTALRLNEKYKNDLANLERKIKLANHDKFEKLLKHNLELEAEVAALNQPSRETTVNNKQEAVKFEQKVSEAKQTRNRISHLELINNSLKVKYEEMKIDLDTKSMSIAGLKQKIVDLHIELQMLNVSKTKLSNDLHVAHNNFNSLKKSELWYKEQLHASRLQKSVLNEELARLRAVLIVKEQELSASTGECFRLNTLLDEFRKPEQQEESNTDSETYEHTINSLKSELVALRNAVEAQRCSFDEVAKQNEELQRRSQLLTAAVEGKDELITNLENTRKDLSNEVDILKLNVKDVSELISKTVSEKSEVELALLEARKEKGDVECAINLIRSDFSKFVKRYNNLKAEVSTTDCLKRQLEEEKTQLESIKEQLLKDLRNSNARVTHLENNSLVQQEKVQSLQKLFVESREKEIEKFRVLAEELEESRRVTELLQAENQQLKECEKNKHRLMLRNLRYRVKQIEARCKSLHRQGLGDEEEISALKEMCSFKIEDENECVKNLKALCRAKDLEMKEKRQKYECSYRTLLRKVKEHMRARNAVEKRCVLLQELHDSVFEELNSYKLQSAFKENDLQNECYGFKEREIQLNAEVMRLEKVITSLKANEASARELIAQLEDQIVTCTNELHCKQTSIEQLQFESDKKDVVISQMEHKKQQDLLKIKELTVSKNELERLLEHEVNTQKEFSTKYDLEQQRYSDCNMHLEETKRMLQQTQMQNDNLTDDLEALSKDFDFKANELKEALCQKHLLELKSKREEDVICCLQSDVQTLQSDLHALKSDKYFLQRLCTDLKFALTTTKNHSDVLKKHIEALSVEQSSPPNSLDAPGPRHFDETYISKLLQRSIGCPMEQPLDNLHSSLNLLKNEMASLRRQVVGNSRCKF